MNLGELIVQLGVKADTFTVKDFRKAIDDIPLSVATSLASLAGLSWGFVNLTQDVLTMTTGLKVFTATTGLNTDSLQQWQQAARNVGLSADVATTSIARISQLTAGLGIGRGDPVALTALAQLGVKNLRGNAYDIMNSIQEATKGKDRAKAAALLATAGISPEMMRVFDISKAERSGYKPTMSTSDQNQMAEFTKALSQFNSEVMSEFVKVLREFEPYMKDLTEVMIAILGTFGGWVAHGVGEDARLLNTMRKNGAGKTIMDILSSYETPEMTRDPAYTRAYHSSNTTIHVHGVQDPNAVVEVIDQHNKRHQIRALKAFNNQGS